MGYALIIIGLFLISFPSSITGAVIDTEIIKSVKIILGLGFVVGGIVLVVSRLEEITVYSKYMGNEKYEPHLLDSTLTFGKYDLTLDEFREGVNKIKDDRELMQVLRETYVSQLESITGSKRGIALQFLGILEKVREPEYKLTSDEKRDIINAFKQWNGRLTLQQREVLNRFGISSEHGTKHYLFRIGSGTATTSSTPSDVRTGQNFAHQLMKLIGKHYHP